MDSESDSKSEDFLYEKSYDESEDDSDLEEEFNDSLENISITPRNWRKGNFNPRLFSFDSVLVDYLQLREILVSKHRLTSSNYFSIQSYLKWSL